MSPHDDELEERLRRHYRSTFGTPPDRVQVRELVARRLEEQADSDTLELIETGNGRMVHRSRSTNLQAGPTKRAVHPTTLAGGRWRTLVALAATVLVVATGVAVFSFLAAHHRTIGETSSTQLPGHPLTIVGIQMLSDTDGWAIGNRGPTDPFGVGFTGVVLHFDGYRWSVADTLADSELNSISMTSATDGWIAGDAYHKGPDDQVSDTPLALRYSGEHWVHRAAPLGLIRASVHMVTATFGWVDGLLPSAPQILTGGSYAYFQRVGVYYNGVWTNTRFVSPGAFDVWFTSPTEGWAVAQLVVNAGAGAGEFWHYTGGHWSEVSSGVPTNLDSPTLEMTGPTNGWAFGYPATVTDGIVTQDNGALLLHYDGVSWTEVPVPANLAQHVEEQAALAVVSPTEIWIGGYTYLSSGPVDSSKQDFLLHYTSGVWSEVKEPTGFYVAWGFPERFDILAVMSSQDVWMVGNVSSGSHGVDRAAIAHYIRGQWIVFEF